MALFRYWYGISVAKLKVPIFFDFPGGIFMVLRWYDIGIGTVLAWYGMALGWYGYGVGI